MVREALAAAGVMLLLVACRSDSEPQSGPLPFSQEMTRVSRSEIAAAGVATPGGVVLAWWAALQRGDAREARSAYAPTARVRNFRRALRRLGPFFATARPRLR